jgi:hypothetical protein
MRNAVSATWKIFVPTGVLFCLYMAFVTRCEAFVSDDFEYWNSPSNHGWTTSDPSYPVMGYNVGYGLISTQPDPPEGSRVLTVHSTPSVFNRLQPYCLANYHLKDPNTGQTPQQTGFSYKIKAPESLEKFKLVQCYLLINTEEGEWIWLNYFPLEGKDPVDLGSFDPLIPPPKSLIDGPVHCISYPLGREIQDSTWHLVVRDLQNDLNQAMTAGLLSKPAHLEAIDGIIFSGNEYSLDEITFYEDLARYSTKRPTIYCPGPQFATLFEPFELILYANAKGSGRLTFDVRMGGWGIHGAPVNEGVVVPLPFDPNDPMSPYSTEMAAFRFTPQCLEDLIVTATVKDHYNSDAIVFPLSVINYHLGNNPPVIQRMSKLVGYIGKSFSYQVKVFDKDRDRITYSATIDGLPDYQFGPWQESIIDVHTGLIQFTPQFEGKFKIMITVEDIKGAIGQISKKMSVTNQGTWLNHSPSGTKIYSPQLASAGELFTMVTSIVDPDGDKLYYSTNIGSISSDGVYSFLTYSPGQYNVVISACDIHGGCAKLKFFIDVEPWWGI